MIKTPIFVGFFPKITSPAPDWVTNKKVKEICSVGNCISEGPDGWLELARHNKYGFFDSVEVAHKIPSRDREKFDMYAYRLFPVSALQGKTQEVSVVASDGGIPGDFSFLGHDIVSKSASDFFECSPLSCNNAAQLFDVNEYCLIPDVEAAHKALIKISREESYEPGPYYLFEVHRKCSGKRNHK